MGGLFSKQEAQKKATGVSSNDRAVLELKRQRDRLKKFRAQAEKAMERETELAKELIRSKDKRSSIFSAKH